MNFKSHLYLKQFTTYGHFMYNNNCTTALELEFVEMAEVIMDAGGSRPGDAPCHLAVQQSRILASGWRGTPAWWHALISTHFPYNEQSAITRPAGGWPMRVSDCQYRREALARKDLN